MTFHKFSENIWIPCKIINMIRIYNRMRWEIMDMRDLKVEAESFKVVFDKGGLDALVADETPEIRADAIKMLSEVIINHYSLDQI